MSALLYKQQADSLAKHFSEFHKITLNDIHALEAVKAIHGRSTGKVQKTTADPMFRRFTLPQSNQQAVEAILDEFFPPSNGNPGLDFYRQSALNALTVVIDALAAIGEIIEIKLLSRIFSEPVNELPKLLTKLPDGQTKTNFQLWLENFKIQTKDGLVVDSQRMKENFGGLTARLYLAAHG